MEPTFSGIESTDLSTLLGMMREYYASDRIPFHPEWARDAVTRLLKEPGLGRIWIVRADGAPVGYACLCFGYSLEFGRDAFLDELFVNEAHRNRGIGRAAVEFVTAQCRALGVQALHLVVAPHNEGAYRLYRRIGFEDQDRSMMTRRIAQPQS